MTIITTCLDFVVLKVLGFVLTLVNSPKDSLGFPGSWLSLVTAVVFLRCVS